MAVVVYLASEMRDAVDVVLYFLPGLMLLASHHGVYTAETDQLKADSDVHVLTASLIHDRVSPNCRLLWACEFSNVTGPCRAFWTRLRSPAISEGGILISHGCGLI